MLAELIAILAGLAATAAYLLGRRAGRQEDPWVLVGDTPPATPRVEIAPPAIQAVPAAAPAAPEAPVAARTVHWKVVVKDPPVRALRNWTRLARTARRLRRPRIIWSGLGNHLKQFSCLR